MYVCISACRNAVNRIVIILRNTLRRSMASSVGTSCIDMASNQVLNQIEPCLNLIEKFAGSTPPRVSCMFHIFKAS